jgi:hypothetical protein
MRDRGYNESTLDLRRTVLISRLEEEVLVGAAVVDTGRWWIEQSCSIVNRETIKGLQAIFAPRG